MPVARIDGHDGNVVGERQRLAHRLRGVLRPTVELVDGDEERQPPRLEEVHRREAVLQPTDVDEDDCPDRTPDEVAPDQGDFDRPDSTPIESPPQPDLAPPETPASPD